MGKKKERRKLEAQVKELRSTVTSLMRAGYDAAKITSENSKHFRDSAEQAPAIMNDRNTRYILRSRARYEADNNGYMGGLASTLAIDTIGYTYPRLRVLVADKGIKTFIEEEWVRFVEHPFMNLSAKLRIADETRLIEGESFPTMFTDQELEDETDYSINLAIIPPSRVCDNTYYGDGFIGGSYYNDDGAIVNLKTGRPREFMVSSVESEIRGYSLTESNQSISSKYMLQWFNPRRAGQFRGVSEFTPVIPLYAQLRRYGLATLTAAEFAACFAGVMSTKNTPLENGPTLVKDWTKFEVQRGMLLSLPDGWDATQFDAKHPMQSQEMFVNLVLREIGRTLDVPFGIVAGDSSKYNYSSAQLDYRGYEERRKYDKKQLSIRIMNLFFKEWLLELCKRDPRINRVQETEGIFYSWSFANRPSSDPSRDADAEEKRLSQNSTTLDEVYAARGLDWEEALEQRKKENEKLLELGLTNGMESDTIGTDGGNSKDGTTVTGTTTDVQATALNGAQISSLLLVTDATAAKRYPADAAIGILKGAFPLMDEKLIIDFVNNIAEYKAPIVTQGFNNGNQSQNDPQNTEVVSSGNA